MRTTDHRFPQLIWKAAASMHAAIVLLVLIIAASLAGTLTEYDVYHSRWFIALLALFGFNLLACTVRSLALRRARSGSLVTHAGLLAVLTGAIFGAASGERGHISISEGQTSNRWEVDGKFRELPFQLRLDDFDLKWQPTANHVLSIQIKDAGFDQDIQVIPGQTYNLNGSGYSIEVSRFVPDLFVDSGKGVISRSDDPNNPALQLNIRHGGTVEQRWVFAAHPDLSMSRDDSISITYSYNRKPLDFASAVTVLDKGSPVLTSTIRVNHPLKYRGYSIYQAHFDPRRPDWTGLDVVRDPGTGLVFAGFALMVVGVSLAVYSRSRKLRIQ